MIFLHNLFGQSIQTSMQNQEYVAQKMELLHWVRKRTDMCTISSFYIQVIIGHCFMKYVMPLLS